MIDRFIGKYAFLSNFYPVNVDLDEHTYPSVEHAYQAAKTMDPVKRAMIRKAFSPGIAKKMGRTLLLRPGWHGLKLEIMKLLLIEKFSYPDLTEMLLLTGDAELIEGNIWGDSYWGMYDSPAGRLGENHLGKLLMQIRKELKS